jgi:hypothetical protein
MQRPAWTCPAFFCTTLPEIMTNIIQAPSTANRSSDLERGRTDTCKVLMYSVRFWTAPILSSAPPRWIMTNIIQAPSTANRSGPGERSNNTCEVFVQCPFGLPSLLLHHLSDQ